ncbi:phage baseplate assembly protein [Komagataeibacter diospyri]|uniref:phage baseplate assembly protein n=1 Tax=Komagataeibacter diospyri TaxID=1932662 RepID=UPI00350E5B5A
MSKVNISEGDSCRLLIGKTLVFTGYVQTVVEDIAPDHHTFEVQLASKSVDLVECAAEFSTFQMNIPTHWISPGGSVSSHRLT